LGHLSRWAKMSTKRVILAVVVASFIISLLISTLLAYVRTEALTETRKSALIRTLSAGQIRQIGAFHWYDSPGGGYWWERRYVSELSTGDALLVLKMLNASHFVDVDQALRYIAYKQYQKDTGAGGFGAMFDGYGTFLGCDLYSTYKVVRVLNLYDALDRINQTMMMDFVTKRYNGSIGAFHELVTEVDGRQYASSRFPMVFRSFNDNIAYGIPNVLTTYAGVQILKELNRLEVINTTKILEWVMHCQAENGMFMPYPDASYMPIPDWSPLRSNPFEVDEYGTGVPYTFAAVSTLEALGRLDTISAEDKQKMKDYIIACQGNITGEISIHKDYDYRTPAFTFEAVMILHHVGMLDEAQNAVGKIEDRFQEYQMLHLDNSWPIPYPGDLWHPDGLSYIETSERYGLHHGDTGPPTDSYYAMAIFNATGHWSLLDQPTPRVQRTWLNLIELSALATAMTTIALVMALEIQKRRQKKIVEAKSA